MPNCPACGNPTCDCTDADKRRVLADDVRENAAHDNPEWGNRPALVAGEEDKPCK